jgi:hypothetical protein
MFTRSELEIKTIAELKDLCRRYGIKPTGNAGYKVSYITSLMAFPAIALHQMNQGRGLKRLTFGTSIKNPLEGQSPKGFIVCWSISLKTIGRIGSQYCVCFEYS